MAIVEAPTALERALLVTPGASQTRSKAPGQVGPRDVQSGYPLFAQGGQHAAIQVGEFTDGRLLLDCFGANAAIPLGYGRQDIVEAVSATIRRGSLLSLPSEVETFTSNLFLRQCAPWASMVRWVRTGSEAVSAAIRLARIATGRDKIVVFEGSYHGWHDTVYARHHDEHELSGTRELVFANGVPVGMAQYIAEMPYGSEDWSYLSGSRTAALLVEAHRFQPTDRAWLQTVVNKAREAGAVVIFDEMVYGLRWAMGGAAEYYDVIPDLACFGKALGNGVPVACVCGTKDLMAPAAQYVSGTYGGDLLGLVAAQTVLQIYQEEKIIEQLWDKGDALHAAFKRFAPADFSLEGFPVHWRLKAPSEPLLERTLLYAAKAGVLVHRASNNASAAMTAEQSYECGKQLGIAARFAATEA